MAKEVENHIHLKSSGGIDGKGQQELANVKEAGKRQARRATGDGELAGEERNEVTTGRMGPCMIKNRSYKVKKIPAAWWKG